MDDGSRAFVKSQQTKSWPSLRALKRFLGFSPNGFLWKTDTSADVSANGEYVLPRLYILMFKHSKCKSQYSVFHFLLICLKNLLKQHLDYNFHPRLFKTTRLFLSRGILLRVFKRVASHEVVFLEDSDLFLGDVTGNLSLKSVFSSRLSFLLGV